MLKQNWRLIARLERLGDALIVVLAFFTAYYGRDSLLFWDQYFGWQLPFHGERLAPLRDYGSTLLIALVTYSVMLNLLGAYGSMRLSSSVHLLKISVVSSFVVFIVLSAALFLVKLDLSRSFVLLFCTLVALSLAAERYLVLNILRYWRRRGMNFRNVIVCGVGEQASRLAKEIAARRELGLFVRAFADLRSPDRVTSAEVEQFRQQCRGRWDVPVGRVLRGMPAVEQALKEYAIDEVIFTDIVQCLPEVEEMILACAEQGVRTTIIADLFSIAIVKSGISYFGDMPLIHFQTPPGDRWELSLKRLIDLFVSAVLLIILSPLFVLVALLVKVTSPGPVIFVQRRVGLNGRHFSLYKFRSMYVDSERKLEELREQNEMSGPVFKMRNDPRITPVGKLLRRFSVDELPQFWNVFKGDMSLVGPRPPVPGEVTLYERKDRRRLSMRPGLTCTWQVSGRNNIPDFESWVKLDLDYIDNWSLANDLVLLFRTIPAVLFGTGAR